MKSWIHQVLVVFLVSAIDQGWTQKCSNRDIGFELITGMLFRLWSKQFTTSFFCPGYVFTAPEFILDTSPGVLLLEECLLLCHRNTSCFSINYETGLCVLFTSSAEVNPGKKLAVQPVSQYRLSTSCQSLRRRCFLTHKSKIEPSNG